MSKKIMVNPRNAYGEALIELGKKHKNLVVLDADLSKSTKTIMFAKKYPERFFEMGIAEANMITTAAGLASCGKLPFVSTFAVFATGRVYDQIRIDIAYSNANVKIFATHNSLKVVMIDLSSAVAVISLLRRKVECEIKVDSRSKIVHSYAFMTFFNPSSK